MRSKNNSKRETSLEMRLRDEAQSWAEQLQATPTVPSAASAEPGCCDSPKLVDFPIQIDATGQIDTETQTLELSRWRVRCVLAVAASLLCLVASYSLLSGYGVFSRWPTRPDSKSQAVAGNSVASPLNSGTKLSELELKPLLATTAAIRQIADDVSEGTQAAFQRKATTLFVSAPLGVEQLAFSLPKNSRELIEDLALEPGRRYGNAALWFNGQVDRFNGSSLTAATRFLTRGRPSPPSGTDVDSSTPAP